MSEKQKEILEIIETFIKENGYSPTVRDICRLSGLRSTSSVHGHIKKLKATGHITNGVEMPRTIALTNKENSVKFIINVIALMYEDDKEYILLKENKKEQGNDICFELPGGVIRAGDNVYGALRRKLKSKGFEVTKIFGGDKYDEISEEEEALTVFKPFCGSQSFARNNSIISNSILCEVAKVKVKNDSTTPTFKWVCTDIIKTMLVDHKENISTHNIAALKLFCEV